MRRRWRAAIKRTVAAATADAIIIETVLACWAHRTDDTVHTLAADQESDWRPPALVQRGSVTTKVAENSTRAACRRRLTRSDEVAR